MSFNYLLEFQKKGPFLQKYTNRKDQFGQGQERDGLSNNREILSIQMKVKLPYFKMMVVLNM